MKSEKNEAEVGLKKPEMTETQFGLDSLSLTLHSDVVKPNESPLSAHDFRHELLSRFQQFRRIRR